MWSWQGAIQIHVHLTFTLTLLTYSAVQVYPSPTNMLMSSQGEITPPPPPLVVHFSNKTMRVTTNPDFFISLTFGFVTKLLVVLFHQSTYLSVRCVPRVIFLTPDIRLAGTVALPVRIEHSHDLTTVHRRKTCSYSSSPSTHRTLPRPNNSTQT